MLLRTWPLTELNGRKGFMQPTPKNRGKGFVVVVVISCARGHRHVRIHSLQLLAIWFNISCKLFLKFRARF